MYPAVGWVIPGCSHSRNLRIYHVEVNVDVEKRGERKKERENEREGGREGGREMRIVLSKFNVANEISKKGTPRIKKFVM